MGSEYIRCIPHAVGVRVHYVHTSSVDSPKSLGRTERYLNVPSFTTISADSAASIDTDSCLTASKSASIYSVCVGGCSVGVGV